MIKVIETKLEPCKELIDQIKSILKDAESGQLRSFIGIGQYNNKDMSHCSVIDKDCNVYAMLGALECAKDMLLKDSLYLICEK